MKEASLPMSGQCPQGAHVGAFKIHGKVPLVVFQGVERGVVEPRHEGSSGRTAVGMGEAQAPHLGFAGCELRTEGLPLGLQFFVGPRPLQGAQKGVELPVLDEGKLTHDGIAVLGLIE